MNGIMQNDGKLIYTLKKCIKVEDEEPKKLAAVPIVYKARVVRLASSFQSWP